MWKIQQYAAQSAKIGDTREVGRNRGRGQHDYPDVNGCSRRHGQRRVAITPTFKVEWKRVRIRHTNAGQSNLGALIKGLGSALRTPTEDENIFYTRLDTGIREGCQILRPTDKVRYLTSAMKREATMEATIIVEGCRRSGLHWVSQMLTGDGNTWVAELQTAGNSTTMTHSRGYTNRTMPKAHAQLLITKTNGVYGQQKLKP
jgi:hypothetical protein